MEPAEEVTSRGSPAEPRFIADAMLGRLARWLRSLGYDTVYEPATPDAGLCRRAQAEGRTLLTRDRALLVERRPASALFIRDDDPLAQLVQVVGALGLEWRNRPACRCTACNGTLDAVEQGAVAGRVPPWILDHHQRFAACRGCGRIYWAGTHAARMKREIRRVLADPPHPGPAPGPGAAT